MNRIDAAWAAGFYEGEGHLSSKTGNGGPIVSISQCNKEPLEKLQSMYGGQIYGPRQHKTGVKDVYVWSLTKHADSRHFIYSIFPWLSSAKRDDVLQKIDRYSDIILVRKTFCSKGHNKDVMGSRPGSNGGRVCTTCESQYKKRKYMEKKIEQERNQQILVGLGRQSDGDNQQIASSNG